MEADDKATKKGGFFKGIMQEHGKNLGANVGSWDYLPNSNQVLIDGFGKPPKIKKHIERGP